MKPLVERLREQAHYEATANNSIKYPPGTQKPEDTQAWKDADEVERLRETLQVVNKALWKYRSHQLSHQESYEVFKHACHVIEAALETTALTGGQVEGAQ